MQGKKLLLLVALKEVSVEFPPSQLCPSLLWWIVQALRVEKDCCIMDETCLLSGVMKAELMSLFISLSIDFIEQEEKAGLCRKLVCYPGSVVRVIRVDVVPTKSAITCPH